MLLFKARAFFRTESLAWKTGRATQKNKDGRHKKYRPSLYTPPCKQKCDINALQGIPSNRKSV